MRWLTLLLLLVSSVAWGRGRVVVVVSDDLAPYRAPVAAFLDELGEPALVVNLNGRSQDADALVRRLAADPPEVVFCLGAKAAYAVRNGLPEVPMVHAAILRPERYGIDGRRVTGVGMTVDPVVFLSQFKGFFPEVERIGLLRGPSVTDARIAILTEAAEAVGVELVVERVRSPRGVRQVFFELAPRVDALWVQPDQDILRPESYRSLAEETRRRRMPLLVETDNMVRAGGLFAVVPDPDGVGRQSARLVRQLLEGDEEPLGGWSWPEHVQVALNVRTLEQAEMRFDRLLLDFVDIVVE